MCLNLHPQPVSGDLYRSYNKVRQGFTEVSPKASGNNHSRFCHTLVHVMMHVINSGSRPSKGNNPHWGLNTWDASSFVFRTEEASLMRAEEI